MTTEPKHNYIAGKAYKMRNGEKAVFIGENPHRPHHPLVFSYIGSIFSCTKDGFYHDEIGKHAFDIIGEWPPEPKKVKGWLNIYPPVHRDLALVYCVLATKEQCDVQPGAERRIACIPIEFTEGEGL